jgi:dinuclear metal center YbgI/SA1388 family protein
MKIIEVLEYFEQIIPVDFQENYDNCGLQVGNGNFDLKQALITLDVTEEILEEAISKNCNLIISHHPLIFHGLKKITGASSEERIIEKALKYSITIYSAHTSLDNNSAGLNVYIAGKLGLQNISILAPAENLLKKLVVFCPTNYSERVRNALFLAGGGNIGNYDSCSFNVQGKGSFKANEGANPFVGKPNEHHFEEEVRIELIYPVHIENKIIKALLQNHPYEEVAYDIYKLDNVYNKIGGGVIGDLESPVKTIEFLSFIKDIFGTKCIRHNTIIKKEIQRISFCGGSGIFLVNQAKRSKADIFITSDIKYHDFFAEKILLADIGHFESEQLSVELIASVLMKKFPTFAFSTSEIKSNPVYYF